LDNSNGRSKEGSINRCSNSAVRYTLIEMVWRLLRWQPDYPPNQKLRSTLSRPCIKYMRVTSYNA